MNEQTVFCTLYEHFSSHQKHKSRLRGRKGSVFILRSTTNIVLIADRVNLHQSYKTLTCKEKLSKTKKAILAVVFFFLNEPKSSSQNAHTGALLDFHVLPSN